MYQDPKRIRVIGEGKLKIDVRHGIIYVEREREGASFIRREKKNI